ncbi:MULTISPECIES: NAD-dependent epimerase/dehydratase family protein [Dethiosulfovibrio]|uniref:NAD(P)-dependent oxidoreductase n=2 Tax=Dethiosulfovibrio TaxID=47054 RepID=A0ABS9ENA5_9BACT|nr:MULTISPECIES: NAD(P)-dependent oxidoreductase [Dethiosulfovibrio]MCF4113925.1 NAD(P)-dependent oxidoreductase [Dethiosulfovibrio russensis]MCF4141662.1 NAD(P)-dependent oxidoreductase [Dethiosulfovibrio marinus]MCF4143921.1 NAD(P)-dependent oxidoreductase [Dethiosulfovibrio acidaminovorans]
MKSSARGDLLRSWLDTLADLAMDLADDLKGSRILLTGGTGFVGTWITSLLMAMKDRGAGFELAILSRKPDVLRSRLGAFFDLSSLELIPSDLTAPPLELPRFDMAIHAAGEISPGVPWPMVEKSLVSATGSVADELGKNGCRRFLFISSGAVYGDSGNPGGVAENYCLAPDPCGGDIYGNAKRWAETLSLMYGRKWGMEVTIARCFAFSGSFLPLNGRFALGNFISDGIKKDPVVVRGTGTPLRSYLDGSDMALWLLTLLVRGKDGRPYNVGSPYPISIGDTATMVADMCGTRVEILNGQDGRGDYYPVTDRIEEDLGLNPTVDLAESIERTIVWNGGNVL